MKVVEQKNKFRKTPVNYTVEKSRVVQKLVKLEILQI